MHELLILKIIKDKIINFRDKIKEHFFYESRIIWSPIPYSVSYNSDVDCAIIITISFKHLENDDDEGIAIEAHLNKSGLGNRFITINLNFTRLNGEAIEMDEIKMDLTQSKEKKKDKLNEVFDFFDSYYPIAKKIIVEEYLSRPPSIGNEGYVSN
jgi:hypothetical protein